MKQVFENGGSSAIMSYTYDDLSRVAGVSRTNSVATSASYDSADQSWSLGLGGTTNSKNLTLGFAYTSGAKLSTRTISNSAYAYTPSGSPSDTYNGLNQFTTSGFAYGDGRGNLTSDGSRNFQYDLENRLTSVSGAASMTLNYDAAGRMHQTASSSTEQYLYDGDRLIAEYDSSGNLLRRYVPGQGADESLVWYEGSDLSNRNFIHTDQQGSVIATTNNSGAATVYAYSVAGEPAGGFGAGGPIFRYTGQAQLAAVGLYYYKAREYAPSLNRFLQTDPAGYAAGLNLYAYAGNDPANASDPSGMDAECIRPVIDFNLEPNADQGPSEEVDVTCGTVAKSSDNPFSAGGTVTIGGNAGGGPGRTNQPASPQGANYGPGDACRKQAPGKGMNTNSVSIAGSASFLNVSVQGSFGLAIDGQGHVAFIYSAGGSGMASKGVGLSGLLGVSVSSSNAGSVRSLSGPFAEQSLGGGDVIAAQGSAFEGKDLNGVPVQGGGLTVGFGGGAAFNAGATNTKVLVLPGYGGC